MNVDESESIDGRRLDRLLAFEEPRAGDESGGLDPADSLETLRGCVRLLEEVLPRTEEAEWAGPVAAGPPPERIGRFTILGELGRGGFGVVLRAFDPTLKRQVALKVPRPEVLLHSGARRRFLREGWAASRLEHPNIVPVLEAGEVGPVGYIASALCEGPSLAAWLAARTGAVPPRLAARLIASLAGGIEHAHGRGVLHRDLKPANILLQGEEIDPHSAGSAEILPFVPRICDFGLAKLLDQAADETRTAVVLGSPPYMAPEQADGRTERIGPATDIHGLGAILYEVLTGRPPFRGETGLETLRLVIEADPAPLRSLRPGVPVDLETIALKCLEKRPEHRYRTAAALADDLERFLDGRPITARHTGLLRRSAKWARRRPSQAALAAFLVLAGLGTASALIAGQWWQARQNARLREVNTRLAATLTRAEQSEHDARRRLLASLIKQSQTALDAGHDELASDLLQSARRQDEGAASAGFAWSHLDRRLRGRLRIFAGPNCPVVALEVSPDGKSLASFQDEGPVSFWNLADGRLRSVAPGPFKHFRGVAFSADFRTLAFSHHDGKPRVRLWDVEGGRLWSAVVTTPEFLISIFLADDGKTLAAIPATRDVERHRLLYWDLAAGPDGPVVPLDERDGARRLGFDRVDPALRLIVDALDGRPVAPPSGVPKALRGVAFTADREIVVIARGTAAVELRDRTAFFLAAGNLFGPFAGMVVAAESRPPARVAAPGWEARVDRLRLLAPTGRRDFPLRRLGRPDVPYRFAPSGDRLAIQGAESHPELIDLNGGGSTALDLGGHLSSLAFTPDSRTLVICGLDGRIRLRNLEPSAEPLSFAAHEKEAWGLAWSPDGKSLASSSDDGTVKLWDLAADGPPHERAVLRGHRALVTSVSWSPDGKTLASSGYNPRDVRLWDATTGECRAVLSGHEGIVRMVAWSPDGKSLASCGDDRTLRFWDLDQPNHPSRPPLRRHNNGASGVAWLPHGRALASVGLDGQVILWDVVRAREIRSWNLGTQAFAVACSPDGRRLAAAALDGSIRVWDPASPSLDEALILRGHARWALTLAFAPDGRALASGGIDRTVRIWDPATGQELLTLAGHAGRVNGVAFSPDGETLASCDHAGGVKLWRGGPR